MICCTCDNSAVEKRYGSVVRIDPSGLWAGGLCLSTLFGAITDFTAEVCLQVDGHGDVGGTLTGGGGLGFPGLSGTGGVQFSNAERICNLSGAAWQVGGSAGEGVGVGGDYAWATDNMGRSVKTYEAGVGGVLENPFSGFTEVHGLTTYTGTASFNVPDAAHGIWNWLWN